MPRRFRDWFRQAEKDFEAATDSMQNGHYEWCAFQSQQASEKALKAVLLFNNHEIRGHGILKQLEVSREYADIPDLLWSGARELDRHYIQSRYPNGFIEGYPTEYYDKSVARECVNYAEQFIAFARDVIE